MTDVPDPTSTPILASASQIDVWTGYTQYLMELDGLLRATDSICKHSLSAAAYTTLGGIILATHVALQGVDKQLIDGINAMKNGKAPEYELDPAPLPDWPTDTGGAGVFPAAWQTIRAVLERMMGRTTPSSAMAVAIAGLISSGDAIIKPLEAAFG